jgi:murein DD-endopeptidase MepM/ murein hydrolase activator NlpD
VDYVAPAGTPVKAAGDGRVISAVSQGGYGNCVHIRHDNSYSTLYGHLSRFAAGIREGVRVRQGQTIGFVGSSGLSTGPHLDYRMMRGNHFVNPLKVSMPPVTSLPDAHRGAFDSVRTRLNRLLGTGETGQLYASHQ